MKPSTKLVLDILMGAVVPILILNQLTSRVGAPTAYVLAALVPVGWVLADLLFITRRFNVITTVIGLSAVASGLLAFWFVDGVRYAFKDTFGLILTTAFYGGSILVARPVMRYFFAQAMNADTPAKQVSLRALLAEPRVARAMVVGTLLITLQHAAASVGNFLLDLNLVTASFGTGAFNAQVAQVNAITRIALPLASLAAFFTAFWLIYAAAFSELGEAGEGETDFWTLMALREQARQPQASEAGNA